MKYLLILILAIGMFPLGTSFSQQLDRSSALGIELVNLKPYHYTDSDGYTIILGQVKNIKDFPVTDVKVWGGFYGESSQRPIESQTVQTTIDVIPANGVSPFMIRSTTPNDSITDISVTLLAFNSAGNKESLLFLESKNLNVTSQIEFSGSITNNGGTIQDTLIHLALYDSFSPPRLIFLDTINATGITPNQTLDFQFIQDRQDGVSTLTVFAESSDLYSNKLDMELVQQEIITKRVSINSVFLTNSTGSVVNSAFTGVPINIQSNIQLSVSDNMYNQSYIYYAKIVQSGEKAYVEYIGTFDGHFIDARQQNPFVTWTPRETGLYFVDTFVWDKDNVPIASKGPISLILVK